MSRSPDMSGLGLPARIRKNRNAMLEQLDREDLRKLILLLTRLRGYFETQGTRRPIEETIEIVHALSNDWTRQAAERERHKNNRRIAERRRDR